MISKNIIHDIIVWICYMLLFRNPLKIILIFLISFKITEAKGKKRLQKLQIIFWPFTIFPRLYVICAFILNDKRN